MRRQQSRPYFSRRITRPLFCFIPSFALMAYGLPAVAVSRLWWPEGFPWVISALIVSTSAAVLSARHLWTAYLNHVRYEELLGIRAPSNPWHAKDDIRHQHTIYRRVHELDKKTLALKEQLNHIMLHYDPLNDNHIKQHNLNVAEQVEAKEEIEEILGLARYFWVPVLHVNIAIPESGTPTAKVLHYRAQ